MQHRTGNFASEMKKYVNENFVSDISRLDFLKNFEDWPSPNNESWRLSRLGKLSRKNIAPFFSNKTKSVPFSKLINDSYSLVFTNGVFSKKLSDKLPEEIEISFLTAKDLISSLKEINNKQILSHPTLNITGSCFREFIKLRIKSHSVIHKPIEILQTGDCPENSIHPLILIQLEENSSLKMLETFESNSALIAPLQILNLEKNSKLDFIKIHKDNSETYNLSLSINFLKEGSNCKIFNLINGGAFTRSESHSFLQGEESSMDLNCVYLSSNSQHHDITSSIYHDCPNCSSSQKVKGVLNKNSSGVFQGKIRVEKNAQKTDAQQMSRALILSDKATSNSKPELEIYADDVICSHGATVGELDEDQIFYFLSRGIDRQKARHMLIEAFLSEIIEDSVNKVFLNEVFTETKLAFKNMLDN